MASLIRTLSLGLVVIAVSLHTAAANTAIYPLAQQAGGFESTLSDDEITLHDHDWSNDGPACGNSGSLRLQGVPDYYGDLDNTDGSLTFIDTMSFFIYVNPDQKGPIIEYYSTNGGQGLRLELDDTGFTVYTPNEIVTTASGAISPFSWNHIGFTYNSGMLSLYANCIFLQRTQVSGIFTNHNAIRFGLYVDPTAGTSRYYSGKMACAHFSSDVLTDQAVSNLCHQGCSCENINTTTTTTTHSTPPPSPCEDCLCYEDTCINVGYDYCHTNQCSNCDDDHCCCCEKDIEICTDKPCICIDLPNICSDKEDMDYCHPSECEGHCQGAQCCCAKEVQCPVWSECHCMVQKCSEVANLHDCDICCNDCQFGHCCCCDKDDPVCPKDQECHCKDRSCDEIPGYGYCDPSKCTMASDSSPNSLVNRYWANYVCPSDQCCCKMDTGTCADGLSCTCEDHTCWELGYDYCDCDDVPNCKPEHCCCPRHVHQCHDDTQCRCLRYGTCESVGRPYCDPAVCAPCPAERCCC